MRIGVFMPNWVGDVVMATPALRLLRERLPDADLVGILRPVAAEVLAGVPWFCDTVTYDRRSKQPQHQMWPVIRKLRDYRLDAILLFPNSLRSAFIAWRSGVRERVGIARYGRGSLLTRSIRHPRASFREPASAMEVYQHVVSQWVGGEPKHKTQLMTTADERTLGSEVWEHLGWRNSDRVIVLNSGGAYGPAKDWPLKSFVQLSRRLTEEHNAKVLMMCGPAERENAEKFVALADHPSIQSTAALEPSIGRTKACTSHYDSGPPSKAARVNRNRCNSHLRFERQCWHDKGRSECWDFHIINGNKSHILCVHTFVEAISYWQITIGEVARENAFFRPLDAIKRRKDFVLCSSPQVSDTTHRLDAGKQSDIVEFELQPCTLLLS